MESSFHSCAFYGQLKWLLLIIYHKDQILRDLEGRQCSCLSSRRLELRCTLGSFRMILTCTQRQQLRSIATCLWSGRKVSQQSRQFADRRYPETSETPETRYVKMHVQCAFRYQNTDILFQETCVMSECQFLSFQLELGIGRCSVKAWCFKSSGHTPYWTHPWCHLCWLLFVYLVNFGNDSYVRLSNWRICTFSVSSFSWESLSVAQSCLWNSQSKNLHRRLDS